MLTRRHLLHAAGGLLGLSALPLGRALAASSSRRKFIFVVNYGGWDVTRVFADALAEPLVDTEPEAELSTVGGISFVDHPDRPSVRQLFEDFHERMLLLNGILVPSVAHENCLHFIMTGTSDSTASDWPAIVASGAPAELPLPGMVIDGPSFAGGLGGISTRVGSSGQLQALVDGSISSWSDVSVGAPSSRAEDLMDDYLGRRVAAAEAAAAGRRAELVSAYRESLGTSETLKGLAHLVDFDSGTDLSAQVRLAVELLGMGLTRVATLSSNYDWDTHADNDAGQTTNFEGLFYALNDLMAQLSATPGEEGGSLADETVVVVISEMGRTPQLNSTEGKDHWPYTSAMLIGPGFTGDRVVGAYDSFFYGERLDPASAELYNKGRDLSCDMFGATLLRLAGVDHQDWLPGVEALEGVIL